MATTIVAKCFSNVKIRSLVIVIAIIAIGFLAFRFLQKPAYKNFPPANKGGWVAFGDSLTAGFGASDGNDYPTLLSQRLGIRIHNLGIAGNTTQDGLNRLHTVERLEPSVVLLCLGGNDGLRSIPKEQMFVNIGTIIDRLQQNGAFVVLIGVHSASIFDNNESGFEKLAAEKQVFLIPDILEGVLGNPGLMSDYIHPNDAGYRKIAERLETILHPLMSQLTK